MQHAPSGSRLRWTIPVLRRQSRDSVPPLTRQRVKPTTNPSQISLRCRFRGRSETGRQDSPRVEAVQRMRTLRSLRSQGQAVLRPQRLPTDGGEAMKAEVEAVVEMTATTWEPCAACGATTRHDNGFCIRDPRHPHFDLRTPPALHGSTATVAPKHGGAS